MALSQLWPCSLNPDLFPLPQICSWPGKQAQPGRPPENPAIPPQLRWWSGRDPSNKIQLGKEEESPLGPALQGSALDCKLMLSAGPARPTGTCCSPQSFLCAGNLMP